MEPRKQQPRKSYIYVEKAVHDRFLRFQVAEAARQEKQITQNEALRALLDLAEECLKRKEGNE